jgi:dipeptidyl aminopeptidase/acylaminoacyl peptidase
MSATPTRLASLASVAAFFVAAALAGRSAANAESEPDADVAALRKVRSFREAALSPDGKRVAWVETLPDEQGNPTADTAIFIRDLGDPDGRPRRITAGDGAAGHSEHAPAWSRDGRLLAFLSDKDKEGQLQLFVAPAAGGTAKRLTGLTGSLAGPRWSPDGKRLGLLVIENAPREAGPTAPGAAEVGVIEETDYTQRLCTVDAETGKVRPLSPADLYVYEYDWSPDGSRCVLSAAHGNGDNNWYLARLYTLAMDTGELREILKPSMQVAVPRWSPDGRAVAFVGGLMSDEGSTGGDVWVVPASGGTARNLTPDLDSSASGIAWDSSRGIVFSELLDGGSGLGRVDPSGRVTRLWKGAVSLSAEGGAFAVSSSANGKTFAFVRSGWREPPEVCAGPAGEWRPVTQANAAARPAWGKVESLHWDSDPFRVQGWLLYPCNFDPGRRYPLVVQVHGGPAWATTPSWLGPGSLAGALSRRGYFVLFPNPRGSFGQGERFARANVKDFGHGDLRDILSGVDAALKAAPVDPARLGITGWSYGGYMTMWAVTQTNRFKAAVAGAGIANWQSYYGQNGIDQWLIPYFGASVYDDPEVYARSSPINFIKRVKTPTLVLVGERDVECPPPQSREFYHALKTLGVRTQLVIYPGEGHGVRQPAHRRDVLERSLGWFDGALRPGAGKGG